MTAVHDLDGGPVPSLGKAPDAGWRLGLIGGPAIAHSISPPMQEAALRDLGIPGTYARWQTEPADLAERVASLRSPGVLGANVTVPYKEAVLSSLDAVTPLVARAGAANTIVRRGDRLVGDNTDVYGFTEALRPHTGDLARQTAIVLGAGGASRAVIIGLEALGAARIVIANRNVDRARALIADLDATTSKAIPLTGPELDATLAEAAVLVNATALGWNAGEWPIPAESLARLPNDAHVTDLTYRDTDLLLAARARGLGTSDGLEMLILQGARALWRWTGIDPPVNVMRATAVAAREA